jgi:hypothetical protein
MGNEIVMLGALGIGAVILLKSGFLNSLGGGGGDAGDAGAPPAAAAPPPAAPDPAMQVPAQQYPVGVPQPYPVGYPVGIPLDYIYLQDNLVGGYCHLNGRRVCWVGPSGYLSCFNLNDHDYRGWGQDNNLRLRVCRNIRGRYISQHPLPRFPKNQHHTPHRTNQDHNCGNDNHWENNHCQPNHPGGGGPPGGGHGGPPGGDHGGPPGGDHNCGPHQHWDDGMHHCVNDSTPPPGGGPPHPGGTGGPPPTGGGPPGGHPHTATESMYAFSI